MAKRDITPVKNSEKDPSVVIKARKANLLTMLELLRAMIEGVPDNGTWGTAGDLAHYEDIIGDLTNPEE